MAKKICSVLECLNTNVSKPTISFFSLPKEPERYVEACCTFRGRKTCNMATTDFKRRVTEQTSSQLRSLRRTFRPKKHRTQTGPKEVAKRCSPFVKSTRDKNSNFENTN
ncbi:hypothetical protein HW555_012113 [Spodoptera exigua]|uniref:Uncharacterized protein n=1 Tax=Spodoptera exigua TaxID=7107 RepID=A0A835KZC7_SPOEX|nr:hypothetical protein HW555_012113 [Spodoptera exigua]